MNIAVNFLKKSMRRAYSGIQVFKAEENSKEKNERATYLHSDRFLPHFKLYYAPHEITIEDAPLEYVCPLTRLTIILLIFI